MVIDEKLTVIDVPNYLKFVSQCERRNYRQDCDFGEFAFHNVAIVVLLLIYKCGVHSIVSIVD